MSSHFERFKNFTQESGKLFDSETAAGILKLTPEKTATTLSRWAKRGLISRVSHGLYAIVSIDTLHSEFTLEDPWVLAPKLFSETYIGGTSALQFWDLTEQIFNTVFVFTPNRVSRKNLKIGGQSFLIKHIQKDHMFGLSPTWRDSTKIMISDIHRTFIDIFDDPGTGGGIQHACDSFKQYLKHKDADLKKLEDYASRFNNRSVFKRMGFLLSKFFGEDHPATRVFKAQISKGYSYLDPNHKENVKLITDWNLFIPIGFEENLS